MEIKATLILLLCISLALLIIVAIICGIAKIFGSPFKKNFKRGAYTLLITPTLVLYGAFIERETTQVNDIVVTSEKLPQSFDGYRIVQISDIHLRSFNGREAALNRRVDKINHLAPDAIMFTGDLVSIKSSELDFAEKILRKLKANDGIYSVLGTHDYCFYYQWDDEIQRAMDAQSVVERQKAMGWHLLMNENMDIIRGNDTISVIGVENTSSRMKKFRSYGNLAKALQGAEGGYKILLTHDPSHWRAEVVGRTEIDLTLSGHTHGMQSSIAGWSVISHIYKEWMGLYREGNQSLYVNIGLGETMFPFRIGAAPEITVITLKRANNQ